MVKVPLYDDFFVLVVRSHILAAAMKMLEISDVKGIPTCSLHPDLQDEWMEPAEHRKKVLHQISKDFVKKFVDFKFNQLDEDKASSSDESMAASSDEDMAAISDKDTAASYEDDVFLYVKRLLSLDVSIWNTVIASERVTVIVTQDAGDVCYQCSIALEGKLCVGKFESSL